MYARGTLGVADSSLSLIEAATAGQPLPMRLKWPFRFISKQGESSCWGDVEGCPGPWPADVWLVIFELGQVGCRYSCRSLGGRACSTISV